MPTSLTARLRRPAVILAAAAVFLGGLAPAAIAADALKVTTPYPSVAVAPGSKVSFDVSVSSGVEGTVALSLSGTPSGWKATINGGGNVVSGVTVASGKPGTVRLDVTVPGDTTVTSGNLRLTATQGSATDVLAITVQVNAAVAGNITLTTPNPTLTGASDSPFTFDLTLANGTAQDQTVSATATGPTGWSIDTKLASAQAASTVVKAGDSTTITVTATPPTDAPAGHTDITVTATAGSQTINGTLGIDITGTFKLTLGTPNDLISAHGPAGSATTQQIVVKNTGTGPLTNVKMTASQPTKWTVTFDQDTIPTIAPGDQATVNAKISPTGEAVTGDYQITINADATGDNGASAARDSLAMTFTVETSPVWLLAGFALIVVIIAALFYVFRTYGRR
ncbi:MAG TPA: NEW3 domain-containing protein [Verrucomicrobiae bacterium]|nr:NEW3 domain-containing protein [Verrucomicrobiae bacterium]